MSVQKMSWLYHATLDPHNTTEFMDWTYSNLVLDWTNGTVLVRLSVSISVPYSNS